jgi:hypothetical protein
MEKKCRWLTSKEVLWNKQVEWGRNAVGLTNKEFCGVGAPQVDHSTNNMKKVRRRLTNKQVEWGGNAVWLTNEEVL